jgi:hypothetical protein
VYTADEEVASTSWMFDCHGIFHNFHVGTDMVDPDTDPDENHGLFQTL